MFGKVYVVEFENGLVKIGRSKNAEQRIRNLETQSCNKAHRIHTTDDCFDYKSAETKLLRKFKTKRKTGEYIDETFENVVIELQKIKLDIFSVEKYEELIEDTNKRIEALVSSFDYRDKECVAKLNKNTHCCFCLIPLSEFVENKHLNCEEYSNLMDIKGRFLKEEKFWNYATKEGYSDTKIKEFEKIQIDLGDWY